ncbi:hypothetical protein HAX54_013362 [Datura stramonium]|uniref:Uncharacterized protein n=1 Tax=Datura stramonium TaxID=4076 RepID=A0ABS8TL72_DATST|nr:hypothetical protein [Datura stramonium]
MQNTKLLVSGKPLRQWEFCCSETAIAIGGPPQQKRRKSVGITVTVIQEVRPDLISSVAVDIRSKGLTLRLTLHHMVDDLSKSTSLANAQNDKLFKLGVESDSPSHG